MHWVAPTSSFWPLLSPVSEFEIQNSENKKSDMADAEIQTFSAKLIVWIFRAGRTPYTKLEPESVEMLPVKLIDNFHFLCRALPGTKVRSAQGTTQKRFLRNRHWIFRNSDFLCQRCPCRDKDRKIRRPPKTTFVFSAGGGGAPRTLKCYSLNQERKKHINIKKYPQIPPVRIRP